MSRSVRLVVALLISVLLPLTGMAGMVAPTQPCPSQQMTMAGMVGMDHSCFDEEKSAEFGYKVCKMGQEDCQAPAMFTIPAMKAPIVPSGETLLATYHPSAPIANADSFWRPPRF